METAPNTSVAPAQRPDTLTIQTDGGNHRRHSSSGPSEDETLNSSATECSPTEYTISNAVSRLSKLPVTRPHTSGSEFPRRVTDVDGDSLSSERLIDIQTLQRPSDDHMNSIERGSPGDGNISSLVRRTPEDITQSRQKSQYYSEVFAYRDPSATAKDRVSAASMIVAELKTNVILRDEASLLADLSQYLASRYQRQESSIMINLNQAACIYMAGSFQPAYHLTLRGIPSLFQSTLNKRNAALIQTFLSAELHVPPNRGVIKFDPVPEENFATNGQTVFAEIETQSGGKSGLGRSASRSKRSSMNFSKSPAAKSPVIGLPENGLSRKTSTFKQRTKERAEQRKEKGLNISTVVPEEGEFETPPRPPPVPVQEEMVQGKEQGSVKTEGHELKPQKSQKMSKRKSFMNIFGR